MEAINSGEAPDGFKAVPGEGCEGCAFDGITAMCVSAPPCCACHSMAGVSVIYVNEGQPSAPATLLHPMGSMGEEVES